MKQRIDNHVQVVDDQQVIADADKEEEWDVNHAVEYVPFVSEDSLNLFVEIGLVRAVVDDQQAACQVLDDADYHQGDQAAYSTVLYE